MCLYATRIFHRRIHPHLVVRLRQVHQRKHHRLRHPRCHTVSVDYASFPISSPALSASSVADDATTVALAASYAVIAFYHQSSSLASLSRPHRS
ncbi:hypothetical protein C1H46_032077 [Malus baccata]|uniref:Uncharacterized protein n=1 Tax=Malus baccata TaxID=106549 RepID=A0A540L7C4_MALBA|nr:hypothetical protein C1H46_032077 [Malus baccata]